MKSGVYKILNWANDKCYIGSGIKVIRRLNNHKTRLGTGKHKNKHLQAAYNKYGKENFTFTVLEYCEPEVRLKVEQKWMNITKCYEKEFGYNTATIAGATTGYKHSKDILEKISGENHHGGFKGKSHTEETINKISIANKGKPKSIEHRYKIAEIRKGVKASIETRAKMSKQRKGRARTKEANAKASLSMIGKNKKADKWPCPDGWRCKCEQCKRQRNEMNYSYRDKQNASI